MILVLLIVGCSLIGTVLLIGLCAPLSAAAITTPAPIDDTPSTVMEEPFRDDGHFDADREGSVSRESIEEDAARTELREWIASSSVPIMRSQGMTDEDIKSELLRDFSLTEEQVDEILSAQ